jgi:phosphoribosylanthranilate isomerase
VLLGADAIGLVFYAPSPRHVELDQARAIVAELPPFVTVVGLFVNAEPEQVRQTLDAVRVDLLQFHGDETSAYCGQFGKPWIKALRVQPNMELESEMNDHEGASGFLVDAWHPAAMGGTGHRFDWNLLPTGISHKLILAGGLTPDNVAEALSSVNPYALDVSSGVEAGKGIKDAAKMAAFLNEVYDFDYRSNRD